MRRAEFTKIESASRKYMEAAEVPLPVIKDFLRRVKQVHSGATGKTAWEEIGDLCPDDLVSLSELPLSSAGQGDMRSLVVIKLNGGLGTSMGLRKTKSLIPIRGKENFLDIIARQIQALRQNYGVPVPLLLMNSFNTQKDTLGIASIAQANQGIAEGLPVDFLQNRVPRIAEGSLLPLELAAPGQKGMGAQAWCPPGHGDIFFALQSSGILKRLLDLGCRTAFISNGDNLGAVVDPRILAYFHKEKLEWISELTAKTAADRKGGTLFRRKTPQGPGAIELLERAQVPDDHIEDFQDLKRFAYFNVNNLWVDLEALDKKLSAGMLNLPSIVNPKVTANTPVLQLETAMGAAIGCFERSRVVLVPRRRFSPVKTCADLLVRRSDAYVLAAQDAALVPRDERRVPLVVLGSAYEHIQDFEKLFPVMPSLKDAIHLEIKGQLCFDIPVNIKGTVRFTVEGDKPFAVSQVGRNEFMDEDIVLQSS